MPLHEHLIFNLPFQKQPFAGAGVFFNKAAGLHPVILLKKVLQCRCFPMNIVKFLRTPFLKNTSRGCFCLSQAHTYVKEDDMRQNIQEWTK